MSTGIDASTTPAQSVRWFSAVVASFVFVAGAIALEVTGGLYSNSAVPGWAELVAFAIGIASGSSWTTWH